MNHCILHDIANDSYSNFRCVQIFLFSPLGATKTDSPFMGSKCFSKANEELVKRGWREIDWRVDGPL